MHAHVITKVNIMLKMYVNQCFLYNIKLLCKKELLLLRNSLQVSIPHSNPSRLISAYHERISENCSLNSLKRDIRPLNKVHLRYLNVSFTLNKPEFGLLDERTFEKLAEDVLEHLFEKLESFLEKFDKDCDIILNVSEIILFSH